MPSKSSPFVDLHSILAVRQDCPEAISIARNGEQRSWKEFICDVQHLANKNQLFPEERYCLHIHNSYHFAVAFFSLLSQNKTIILPPNAKVGTLTEIKKEVDGFILDALPEKLDFDEGDGSITILSDELFSSAGRDARSLGSVEIDPNSLSIELFTSGTTGERKRTRKSLRNFNAELAVLESLWGTSIDESAILATVSHQHIYGLLYKVLWPLAARRPFFEELPLYFEDILTARKLVDKATLISSPAHLKRVAHQLDTIQHLPAFNAVFSSGGLLDRNASLSAANILGCAPTEVLGSTETGGVAYRIQEEALIEQDTAWQVLPQVTITVDRATNRLSVTSPFFPESAPFEMGDTAELADEGKFYLKGRADRLIKIEEKRFAPAEMEHRLNSNCLVQDSAVIGIRAPAAREIVAVAIVLSDEGKTQLFKLGKKALTEKLREHLAPYFDEVLLPKRYRLVQAITEDAQGKRSHSSVRELFEDDSSEDQALELHRELRDNQCELQLYIPANLKFFPGHFPGQPILPGFVQLLWASTIAKQCFKLDACVSSVTRLKFKKTILPEDICLLRLKRNTEKNSVTFSFEKDTEIVSSGTLSLGEV